MTKVFMVQQGSDDWFELRRGVPTASRFDMILQPVKLKPSASQEELIDELIGERLSQIPPEGVENFTNRAIRWGEQCERDARNYFYMQTGLMPQQVGFCKTDDDRLGASPDALIGFTPEELASGVLVARPDTAPLELKCPQSKEQMRSVRAKTLPNAHKCQVHGHMIVTGCDHCWFLSYSPGCPQLLLRIERDDFTDLLEEELNKFYERFMEELSRYSPSDPAEIIGLPGPVVPGPLRIEGPQVEEQAGEIPF